MDNKELEKRIIELEKWKDAKMKQQITFPLDIVSQNILNKYYLSVIDNIFNIGVSGQEFRSLLVRQDNKINVIPVSAVLITFTANATTNIFTLGSNLITGTAGSLSDDTFVTIYSTGTPPDPLLNGWGYFVVNSTGSTIQLSETSGGAAIDITTAGSGNQYFTY